MRGVTAFSRLMPSCLPAYAQSTHLYVTYDSQPFLLLLCPIITSWGESLSFILNIPTLLGKANVRYILSTDIPPKELSERLQENLPRKRCHSNRSTRYLHIFAAILLGSHYQIWKVSRKYLKKFKVKHFEVIYIPQMRKGLSKLVECYASNKKYACEKYSPISCNIMWEREGTIFDIYDNYNNMKNKHL